MGVVRRVALQLAKQHKIYHELRVRGTLGPGVRDFFHGSTGAALSFPSIPNLAWHHPAYSSLVLVGVLPDCVLANAMSVIPDSVYPSGCSTAGEVVERISRASFWDDILYRGDGWRLRRLNTSDVASPRQKNYSLLVDSGTEGEGRTLHTLYFYPRNYVPPGDYRMSPMPLAFEELCSAVYRILTPALPPASLAFGPFNGVQVRGYYEAFKPHTGLHTDNGILGEDGLVDGGKEYTQEPASAVAIVMWGDCVMDMDFCPCPSGVRSRPPVRFPLPGGGALMMLAPDDDCRCKHGLKWKAPSRPGARPNPANVRIALVLRQLRWTGQYDAASSKYVQPREEAEGYAKRAALYRATKRRLYG